MDKCKDYYYIEGKSGPREDAMWFRWCIPFECSQWSEYGEATEKLDILREEHVRDSNRSNYGFRLVKVTKEFLSV